MKIFKNLMMILYEMNESEWDLFVKKEKNLAEWYELLKLKLENEKQEYLKGVQNV